MTPVDVIIGINEQAIKHTCPENLLSVFSSDCRLAIKHQEETSCAEA